MDTHITQTSQKALPLGLFLKHWKISMKTLACCTIVDKGKDIISMQKQWEKMPVHLQRILIN